MGSQTHTPGAGLRPQLIGRRNLLAILEGRRQLEADLRPGVYLKPLGGDMHQVRNPSNPQPYRVGSAAGAQFTPGQGVFLGSHTGSGPDVIIAQPPLGQRGASATAPVQIIRPATFTLDEEGAEYWAFAVDIGNTEIIAALYREEEWQSDRGVTAGASVASTQLIRIDDGGAVGVGSLLWYEERRVWDVEGDAAYTYSVPAGWLATFGVFDAGWVWWIESEEVQHGSIGSFATFFRLRRGRADFTGVETLGTFEAEHDADLGISDDAIITAGGFVLTGSSHGFGSFAWEDAVNGEISGGFTIRMTRSGVGAIATVGKGRAGNYYGLPGSVGSSVLPPNALGEEAPPGHGLSTVIDDLDTEPVEAWPYTATWAGDGFGASSSLYVSADGTEASLYGNPEDAPRLIRNSLTSIGATPSLTVIPELHPTTGEQPGAFFPKE